MRVTYRNEIDSRLFAVIDDVLTEDEIVALAKRYDDASYPRNESDRSDTKHVRTFALDVSLETFKEESRLFGIMENAVRALFPGEELTEYRAYCNLILYGDASFFHRDCHPERTDVTALYFANAIWEREWGGELLFFNDAGDAVHAISPRPGRLVVFRGAIEHRVGIPSRFCFDSRLTVVCKFKAPGEFR